MIRSKLLVIILIFFTIQTITACSPFTPAPRTDPAGAMDAQFSLYSGAAAPMDRWWDSFGAPDLSRLVDDALGGNFGLKEAWARLNQARARAVQAGADIYPHVDGTAAGTFGKMRSDAGGTTTIENLSVGVIGSYEIDLWGRVRSERAAARLEVDASNEDVDTAAISLAAEVADRWVRIIAQRQQLELLEQQFEINRTLLELIEFRFKKAMVSALDVYQQKQVMAQVRANIPLARQEEQLLLSELAVLLGKPPRAVPDIDTQTPPIPGALPPTGVPADLLANRPDIRAAGKRLTAADWQVAAARANRLPAVSLSATARYGEGDLDDIFNNWLLSLSGNLTAPLIDGGRRRAEVDRSLARTDELLWAYRQAVYTAVKEVEDALTREARQREHIEALEAVVDTARRALTQAIERYRNGLIDYLPVLTQILAVQELDRDLIRQKSTLVQYRIGLYRALGGAWPRELVPAAVSGRMPAPGDKDA